MENSPSVNPLVVSEFLVVKIKGKKHEAIMVNLTNLLPEIWDWDNLIIKKEWNNEVKGLITKC